MHVRIGVLFVYVDISTPQPAPAWKTGMYSAIYAWGQDGGRTTDCQMSVNAENDRLYPFILWAQVWKCVTCLCFGGCEPVSVKPDDAMKPEFKITIPLPAKGGEKRKKTTMWMSGSHLSVPFHSIVFSTLQKKKKGEKSYTPMAMKLSIS